MSIASFDGPNKIINITTGTTAFTVKALYSEWKSFVSLLDNAKFLPAFRYVGGDPTTPGQYLGSTFFLINGWKIRPFNGDHTLTIDGNLFTEDQSSPYMSTLSPHTVIIQNTFSNLTTTVETGGSGSTVDANAIAVAVWNTNINSAPFSQSGTIGNYIKSKVLTVAKFLGFQ